MGSSMQPAAHCHHGNLGSPEPEKNTAPMAKAGFLRALICTPLII